MCCDSAGDDNPAFSATVEERDLAADAEMKADKAAAARPDQDSELAPELVPVPDPMTEPEPGLEPEPEPDSDPEPEPEVEAEEEQSAAATEPDAELVQAKRSQWLVWRVLGY